MMADNNDYKENESLKGKSNKSVAKDNIEYQKNLEGSEKKVSLKKKLYVLLTSFKVKFQLVSLVFIYTPIILTMMFFGGDKINELLYLDILQDFDSIFLTYSQWVYFSFIPEFLYPLITGDIYLDSVIKFYMSYGASPSVAPLIYLWHSLIFYIVTAWIIAILVTFNIRKKPKYYIMIWMPPMTLGEVWEYIFKKALQKSNQSLRTDYKLQKYAKRLTNVKYFKKAVESGVGVLPWNKYTNKFTQYLPVFKFFFSRQDSIRANMLAGELNARWEDVKTKKQEVQTVDKFFDLLDSGFKFGATPRDDIKRSITTTLPYSFINIKGEFFHNKEDIFNKENERLLKRNTFILLMCTLIVKNQILPPLLRFLNKNYGVKFNSSEKMFMSNARKIFTIYKRTNSKFDKFKNYDLPISLQYDYPFNEIDSSGIEVNNKKPISESIAGLNDLQLAVSGYVNEINSLLPKLDDFELKQPAFNSIFINNVDRIQGLISNYILKRCFLDSSLLATIEKKKEDMYKESNDQSIKDISSKDLLRVTVSNNVTKYIMEPLVGRMPLMPDAPLCRMYRDGVFLEINAPSIKINKKTNRLILQQMNLSAYSLFKNQLNTLSLGQINYTIDRVYKELEVDKTPNTTLDAIISSHKIYYTFNNFIAYLEEKENQLKDLQ